MARDKAHRVKIARGKSVPWGKEKELEKKPGGSSVGEYKNIPQSEMVGKAGGAPAGSYPVNTLKRAKAALAYAHNAPNPAGIKAAVYRKYPALKKRHEEREGK